MHVPLELSASTGRITSAHNLTGCGLISVPAGRSLSSPPQLQEAPVHHSPSPVLTAVTSGSDQVTGHVPDRHATSYSRTGCTTTGGRGRRVASRHRRTGPNEASSIGRGLPTPMCRHHARPCRVDRRHAQPPAATRRDWCAGRACVPTKQCGAAGRPYSLAWSAVAWAAWCRPCWEAPYRPVSP